jgi:hypothetical protein
MDKKKKELSMDKMAKMDMLKALRKMALDMIHEGSGDEEMDSLQKVTVAAKDEAGLKAGLEKAEEVLESLPSKKMKEEDESEEGEEQEDEEMLAEEDESSEEDEIAQLEAKLEALKAKKLKA